VNGDVVVMDNCGFHHGNFSENKLRLILRNSAPNLIHVNNALTCKPFAKNENINRSLEELCDFAN
jgi:hypothetical protein